MLSESLYGDHVVLLAETILEVPKAFYGWKSELENKRLKIFLVKINALMKKIGLVAVRPSRLKYQ